MEEKVDYKKIIEDIKPELDKVVNFFDSQLQKIKTSRASSSLVEDIPVECFGKKFPLNQLATISIPEPRQILIHPWDKSYIEGIVEALEKTGITSQPVVDKNAIRINLPPLNEEYRKGLVRFLSEKKEQARQTIRKWREEAWSKIQKGYRDGAIREDDKYKGKDDLQDIIDEYNDKLDELAEKKKKEIME